MRCGASAWCSRDGSVDRAAASGAAGGASAGAGGSAAIDEGGAAPSETGSPLCVSAAFGGTTTVTWTGTGPSTRDASLPIRSECSLASAKVVGSGVAIFAGAAAGLAGGALAGGALAGGASAFAAATGLKGAAGTAGFTGAAAAMAATPAAAAGAGVVAAGIAGFALTNAFVAGETNAATAGGGSSTPVSNAERLLKSAGSDSMASAELGTFEACLSAPQRYAPWSENRKSAGLP